MARVKPKPEVKPEEKPKCGVCGGAGVVHDGINRWLPCEACTV